MTEREQRNRKLAEWAGFRFAKELWHHPDCNCSANSPQEECHCVDGCYLGDNGNAPDFYASEEASALLRAEMPRRTGFSMTIQIDPSGYTAVDGLGIPAVGARNTLTAIAEAALKLLESK